MAPAKSLVRSAQVSGRKFFRAFPEEIFESDPFGIFHDRSDSSCMPYRLLPRKLSFKNIEAHVARSALDPEWRVSLLENVKTQMLEYVRFELVEPLSERIHVKTWKVLYIRIEK